MDQTTIRIGRTQLTGCHMPDFVALSGVNGDVDTLSGVSPNLEFLIRKDTRQKLLAVKCRSLGNHIQLFHELVYV